MKILLLSRCKGLNGVQTMLVRLARGFAEAGHEVSTLIFPGFDAGISIELRKWAYCVETRNAWWQDETPFHTEFDVVHCFTGDAFLFLSINADKFRYKRVVVGVYHPRQFMNDFTWGKGLLARWWPEVFSRNSEVVRLHFMNETVRESHASYWGGMPCPEFTLPIPVDLPVAPVARTPIVGKIVTIGRLVSFKNYHRTVFSAMTRCPQLEYHIYGDGPCENEFRNEAKSLGLGERVVFHGRLNYADMPVVLSTAWVFLGMGTALVEASAAGVPSLVAVDSDGRSYGWFHDFSDAHVGERVAGREFADTEGLLRSVLSMDSSEYVGLNERARRRAEDFSTKGFTRAYASACDTNRNAGEDKPTAEWWMPLVYGVETGLFTRFINVNQRHK